MAVISGAVLAGLLMVWAIRHSEGLTLWFLRVVLLVLFVTAAAIGAWDSQPWPTGFRVAEMGR